MERSTIFKPPGHLCRSSPVVAADEGTGGGAAKKLGRSQKKGKIMGKYWKIMGKREFIAEKRWETHGIWENPLSEGHSIYVPWGVPSGPSIFSLKFQWDFSHQAYGDIIDKYRESMVGWWLSLFYGHWMVNITAIWWNIHNQQDDTCWLVDDSLGNLTNQCIGHDQNSW